MLVLWVGVWMTVVDGVIAADGSDHVLAHHAVARVYCVEDSFVGSDGSADSPGDVVELAHCYHEYETCKNTVVGGAT